VSDAHDRLRDKTSTSTRGIEPPCFIVCSIGCFYVCVVYIGQTNVGVAFVGGCSLCLYLILYLLLIIGFDI
jgi:hypothetical protein